MQPLPAEPYEYAEWTYVKPGIDYHVEIARHFYSVPHALVGHRLEARITATSVELFHKGQRVAVHPRHGGGGHSTVAGHMPQTHRQHHQWTPGRFLNWAQAIGPAALAVIRAQLEGRPHPEHGYRACLGLLNLARRYGHTRLEAACHRAVHIGSPSYRSIASILNSGLDRAELDDTGEQRGTAAARQCPRPRLLPLTHPTRREPMLTQQTLDKLDTLRLSGMREAFEQQLAQPATHELAFEERLALLLDREILARDNRRLTRLLKAARLRLPGACSRISTTASPAACNARRWHSSPPASGSTTNTTCCLTGPTGTGKTYLACALGNQACRQGLSARYSACPRLLEQLRYRPRRRLLPAAHAAALKTELLILDDWAIAPLSAAQRNDLMELIEDRHACAQR